MLRVHKLKDHERNHVTHDFELATIIHALKVWRHYLLGKRFLLLTDNIGLKYLFDQQNLNAKQARWLAFLSEFVFQIKHIKGKENKIVDVISGSMHHIHMITISNYEYDPKNQIKATLNDDEFYKKIVEKLQQHQIKQHNSDFQFTEEGLVIYKKRMYIPYFIDLKVLIMNEFHTKSYLGHLEYQKMVTTVRKQYYWLGMKREIIYYIARCIKCQRVKAEHQHLAGLLQPLPIPKWKWEVISMNYLRLGNNMMEVWLWLTN